jgi:hypothetical protein
VGNRPECVWRDHNRRIPAISRALIESDVTPLPAYIPLALDPRANSTSDPEVLRTLMGGQIEGNWPIVIVYFVLLFFNIIGEEFWWRGVILPRQELAFGRWAWLVHGLLWCLFHAFKYFDYLSILPITLAIPYVSQRLKNNTPAIIAHYVVNGLGFLGVCCWFGLSKALARPMRSRRGCHGPPPRLRLVQHVERARARQRHRELRPMCPGAGSSPAPIRQQDRFGDRVRRHQNQHQVAPGRCAAASPLLRVSSSSAPNGSSSSRTSGG